MKTLNTLRKEAQRSTKARGHAMHWRLPFGRAQGPKSQFGHCRNCAMEVLLVEGPAPNGIQIAGEAIAVNCHGPQFRRKAS